MKIFPLSCLAFFAAAGLSSAGFLEAGRSMPEKRDVRFSFTAGAVNNINGMVEETTRKLYDVTGSYWKQADAETFDLNDFGLDDSYPAIGLEYEANGDFFTFMFDASVLKVSAETTARRNYYIGVGDSVSFNGDNYTNMKIPEGTDFSMDMIGALTDFRLLFTPFTVKPGERFSFSPWANLSIMAFLGQYDIDAGEPVGTTTYMNPPETFVIGGQSGGMIALGLPEYGGGGEIRIGNPDGFELVVQGNYAVCNLSGSTKFLTSSRHREKNAEIEHENIFGRVLLQFPLQSGRAFFLGGQFQQIDSKAEITSTSTDPDEILANQERFDKNVSFHLESGMFLLGWTF